MKTRRSTLSILVLASLCVRFSASQGQNQDIHFSAYPAEKVKASSITWKNHFGYRKEEPHNVYILMTQGGFRAPTSENLESLIRLWLTEHPNAEAVVVYTLEPMMTDVPDSKMKSVWVWSGKDNLNVYLIRMGGLPAGTVLLNPGDKTSATREEYEQFFKEAIEAEEIAKKEKLGIWSRPSLH